MPSPEAFPALLWSDCDAFWIVVRSCDDLPLGIVQITGHDKANGYAFLGAALENSDRSTGWAFEGIPLAIDYAFSTWNLRKLYFESPADIADRYRSALGRLLVEEGRLGAHSFHNSAWHDEVILAIYRTTWESVRQEEDLLSAVRPTPVPAAADYATVEGFLAIVNNVLGRNLGADDAGRLMVSEIGLDSLEILILMATCDDLVPGFELPDQFARTDVRLRDVHHYLATWASSRYAQ